LINSTIKRSFENTGMEGLSQFRQSPLDCVIPAWSAGIQVYMDVSGRVFARLDAGHPCRHDGDLYFNFFVGERNIMSHLVELESVVWALLNPPFDEGQKWGCQYFQ
jgi:hypothetical protein